MPNAEEAACFPQGGAGLDAESSQYDLA